MKALDWQTPLDAEAQRDGWGDPEPGVGDPSSEPPPPFPADLFGPFWGEWIETAAEAKGAPLDYVAGALLGGAGALLANVRRARPWPGWVEPPILYVGAVGNPSAGKSPALDAVSELLEGLEAAENADHGARKRKHAGEVEAAALRLKAWQGEVKEAVKLGYAPPPQPEDADAGPPPELCRITVKDTTVERAGTLARDNPRGLLMLRDELAGWVGALGKYGGDGDRAFWLEAHGGRPYKIDRVKHPEPILIRALSIGIVGGIQPDRLASMILAGDDDGLASRFLYVWPQRRPPLRPARVHADGGARDALLRLRRLPLGTDDAGAPVWHVLPLAEACACHLQAWRRDAATLEEGAAGLFLSWLGKLPGMALRLALVLEYLWWCGDDPGASEPERISEKAMLAALAFLDGYAVPMARRAFGDAALPQADRDAATLARWLRRQAHPPERINARELRKMAALPTKEAGRYDAALAELTEAGWVRPAPTREGETRGRARKDWEVNPLLWGHP